MFVYIAKCVNLEIYSEITFFCFFDGLHLFCIFLSCLDCRHYVSPLLGLFFYSSEWFDYFTEMIFCYFQPHSGGTQLV